MRTAIGHRNSPMKYWEIIADRLSQEGWSWGYSKAVSGYRIVFTVDALSADGQRFIVRSDQLLTAFLELERAVR
jgi:hypothetical protein